MIFAFRVNLIDLEHIGKILWNIKKFNFYVDILKWHVENDAPSLARYGMNLGLGTFLSKKNFDNVLTLDGISNEIIALENTEPEQLDLDYLKQLAFQSTALIYGYEGADYDKLKERYKINP